MSQCCSSRQNQDESWRFGHLGNPGALAFSPGYLESQHSRAEALSWQDMTLRRMSNSINVQDSLQSLLQLISGPVAVVAGGGCHAAVLPSSPRGDGSLTRRAIALASVRMAWEVRGQSHYPSHFGELNPRVLVEMKSHIIVGADYGSSEGDNDFAFQLAEAGHQGIVRYVDSESDLVLLSLQDGIYRIGRTASTAGATTVVEVLELVLVVVDIHGDCWRLPDPLHYPPSPLKKTGNVRHEPQLSRPGSPVKPAGCTASLGLQGVLTRLKRMVDIGVTPDNQSLDEPEPKSPRRF